MLQLKNNILKYKDENGNIQNLNAILGSSSDTSLSMSGIGADAKIVGEKFIILENELEQTNNSILSITNGTTPVKVAQTLSNDAGNEDIPVYISKGAPQPITGKIKISYGGTGATNKEDARNNLELYSKSEINEMFNNMTSIQLITWEEYD